MKRDKQFEWDEHALAALRRLWADGRPASEIGKLLGTTKYSVIGKAQRLKLERRENPAALSDEAKAKHEKILKLVAAGRSLHQIAAQVGFSVTWVGKIVADAGMKSQYRRGAQRILMTRKAPKMGEAAPVAAPVTPRKLVPIPPKALGRVEPCSWPIGEPRQPGFRYCDVDSLRGHPYCAEHASIAYVRHAGDRREDAA